MRVLLTGCTSQHVSKSINDRIPTFAGLLKKALTGASNDVVWIEPSMSMDEEYVSSFDLVIVGLVSPNSLVANYLYPALSVAEHAYRSGNLVLMTDAPEPQRLWAGLVAVSASPESLLKALYARRKDYDKACAPEVEKRLKGFIQALTSDEWPLTIAPSFPWTDPTFLTRHIPTLTQERSAGINLDSMINIGSLPDADEGSYWCAEAPVTPWSTKMSKTLALPVVPLKQDRADDMPVIVERLRGSIGTLVSTHRGGEPWWTPAVSISLKAYTPVISDWRATEHLGWIWSMLPANIEEMSLEVRRDLATQQAASYKSNTLDSMRSMAALMSVLKTAVPVS